MTEKAWITSAADEEFGANGGASSVTATVPVWPTSLLKDTVAVIEASATGDVISTGLTPFKRSRVPPGKTTRRGLPNRIPARLVGAPLVEVVKATRWT